MPEQETYFHYLRSAPQLTTNLTKALNVYSQLQIYQQTMQSMLSISSATLFLHLFSGHPSEVVLEEDLLSMLQLFGLLSLIFRPILIPSLISTQAPDYLITFC